MPNKIESNLTPEQLEEFCRRVAQLKNRTLANIQVLAEEFSISVSLMGAKTFRDNTFSAHLARLRRGKEMTEAILSAVKEGSNALDAAEELAAQELLDVLTDVDAEGRPNLGKVSSTILQLRMAASSRVDTQRKSVETEAKLKLAEEQLKKLEAARKERDQKIAAQISLLRSAEPADADAIRERVVAEIDQIMGITPK